MSKARVYRVHGEMVTIRQAAEALGIKEQTMRMKMLRHAKTGHRAWTLEECVEWYEAVLEGRQQRHCGKRPRQHWVHWEMMTTQQAADRLGTTKRAIESWMHRAPRPDGKKRTLADAYEHYAAIRAGREKRLPGKQYRVHEVHGMQMTVKDVAKRLSVHPNYVRTLMRECNGNLERVFDMLDERRDARAFRKIMRVLTE